MGVCVLGIETSCDETGVAIYHSEKGLLADALYSQVALHQVHGGVVPELASRDHVKQLIPLVSQTLSKASLDRSQLSAIAYTAGPGLIGALLTGACFAKSLALALQIPAVAVHHLEAHLLAAKLSTPALDFPFTALLVSGGHTQIIMAHQLGHYELLGETLDDAVGEAFDKTAKLMGIAYPGGPKLAALADACSIKDAATCPPFPRPMTTRAGFDLSFSGLKTHALMAWQKSNQSEDIKRIIAYHFQQAVVETLVIKCRRAIGKMQSKRLVVAGGVGANRLLRQGLTEMMEEEGGHAYFPSIHFCTDNGAMVAYTGCLHFLKGQEDNTHQLLVKARWPLNAN